MMKKLLISFAAILCISCVKPGADDPYSGALCSVSVLLEYPEGYVEAAREGVEVVLEEVNNLYDYIATTDASARARIALPTGLYRISVSDRQGSSIFNGTLDKVNVSAASSDIVLNLKYSKAGTLIIKEIYCGGCKKLPEIGDYQADKYVMLHNNDNRTVYLDSLCFGTLAPYNSNASNPWGGIRDVAPIIQALWQFGGTGTSFPLEPGQDAVLCLCGAIDHTAQYPLSVNLNRPGYFVAYNNTYFTNTSYHPAPGDQIAADHILEVVEKVGSANAYTFSINSPTAIIFRPVGCSIREYVKKEGSITDVPGAKDRVIEIPWEWIIDGVEVFNGASSSNNKRIRDDVDAGFVYQTNTYLGHSLMRNIDMEATEEKGYEVLMDTNNSSADFYERSTASLHDE